MRVVISPRDNTSRPVISPRDRVCGKSQRSRAPGTCDTNPERRLKELCTKRLLAERKLDRHPVVLQRVGMKV